MSIKPVHSTQVFKLIFHVRRNKIMPFGFDIYVQLIVMQYHECRCPDFLRHQANNSRDVKHALVFHEWRFQLPACAIGRRYNYILCSWWHHRMETFSALLAFARVTGGFPLQRPVTRSFDVFFDLRLNKRLSKHSRRQWFKTPSRSLWRHCNVLK